MKIHKKDFTEYEKQLFEQATKSRDETKYPEAIGLLNELLSIRPDCFEAHLVIGGIHYETFDYKIATKHFRESVKLSPKSKIGSLGLFHALWDSGKEQEALKEVDRFLSVSYVEDYEEIVRELMMRPELAEFRASRELLKTISVKLNRFSIGGENGPIE